MSKSLDGPQARALLDSLCTRYGFCLSPLWRARLENNPPRSPEKFTDTVFRAEGLDPTTADKHLYNVIYNEVEEAFERSG